MGNSKTDIRKSQGADIAEKRFEGKRINTEKVMPLSSLKKICFQLHSLKLLGRDPDFIGWKVGTDPEIGQSQKIFHARKISFALKRL